MRYYIIILSSVLLFACAPSSNEAGGEIKEYITDAPPSEDSLSIINDGNLTDSLKLYFSEEVVSSLIHYLNDYRSLESQKDFESNYRFAMNLFDEMYRDLNNPATDYMLELSARTDYWNGIEILEELEIFNGRLGAIIISCAAECTELDFLFDLELLHEKAKTTTGEGDDQFTELLLSTDGSYGYAGYPGFKEWFTPTWDLGGRINIGDDYLYTCIQACADLEKNYPTLFKSEIELMRRDFLDALSYSYIYSYSQKDILTEYNKILNLNFFNAAETAQIREHFRRIELGGNPFQFECEIKECTYG
jgi:uncharacterized protein Veg